MITFNLFLTITGFNDYDYELPANVARSSSSSLCWNRRGRVFSLARKTIEGNLATPLSSHPEIPLAVQSRDSQCRSSITAAQVVR